MGRPWHASGLAGSPEQIAERLLGQRLAALAADEREIATRSCSQRHGQDGKDRHRHLDGEAALFGLDLRHALTDMLPTNPHCVTPAQPGVEQYVEPHSLARTNRPAPLIGGDVLLS